MLLSYAAWLPPLLFTTKIVCATSQENLSSGFQTKSDTFHAADLKSVFAYAKSSFFRPSLYICIPLLNEDLQEAPFLQRRALVILDQRPRRQVFVLKGLLVFIASL